jgi:hypothetical protein
MHSHGHVAPVPPNPSLKRSANGMLASRRSDRIITEQPKARSAQAFAWLR